jgi:hypothetical protein
MIIINYCLNPLVPVDHYLVQKVVYKHTHIASYRHWGARSAGQLLIRLLALDSKGAKLAGGLSSDPILSGLRQTRSFTGNRHVEIQK